MFTLIATVHLIVAVMLILLVLVQDSKGGAGMFTGGGSQSILGATGGASLFAKMTRLAAVVFAITSLGLTVYTAKNSESVTEGGPLPPATPTTSAAGAGAGAGDQTGTAAPSNVPQEKPTGNPTKVEKPKKNPAPKAAAPDQNGQSQPAKK